jgi:plastocyanin
MVHLPVRAVAAIAGALVLTLAAVAEPGSARAESVTIRITATLEPASVTVAPGASITFDNADTERHRMRSTSGPTDFDTGNLDPGQSFTFTLSATGTYRYVDDRDDENPAYAGQIVVSTSAPTTAPGDPPDPPPAPTSVAVSIGDRIYTPAVVTVAPGGTVTWTNDDDRPHTVTADDRSFDSGIMNTGDTWSMVFPNGGTFSYFCDLHPDMRGRVDVGEAGGSPPNTNPPPPTTSPPTTPPTVPPTTVPGGPAPSASTVVIAANQFTPATITVVAGSTVTWTSQDAVPHTVTATDRSFDSGILRQGDTWSTSFPAAGAYAYFCELHPEMTGTVIVVPSGTAAPPPPSPPAATPTTTVPSTPAPPPGAATGGTVPGTGATVSIAGNTFAPRTVTIAVGGSVTWTNADQVPHTVTATDRSYDSGIMFTGDSWTMTFAVPGTYSYFCELHPAMTATVVVTGPGAGAPSTGTGTGAPAGSALGPSEGSSPPDSTASAAGAVAVTMGDNRFQPVSVTVGTGGTVTWTNTDSIPHTVTAEDGSFDSGIMMPGDTFSHRFDQVGTVPYRCTLHPGMNATVEAVPSSSAQSDDSIEVASGGSAASAGGGTEPTDAASAAQPSGLEEEVVVRITESEFPAVVTIATGQRITWVNDDDRPVDVVADDGSFASGELAPGDRYSRVFAAEGATSYRSEVRDRMAGMVVVLAGPADEIEIMPTVAVYDAWFAPRDLVVHQGDTVRWAFGGVLPHTVTAGDETFDSGVLEPGAIFTSTFDELGTYSYSCIVHPAMIGSVTVVPADEDIPASRSGISAVDAGGGGERGVASPLAPVRREPSDGAGAMVLLGLGLMVGLAVGVLFGVGKTVDRRAAVG